MLGIILGLVAILALFLAQGNFVQGLMRPAYNENKCYDSDGGQKYGAKGTTYGKMLARNSKTQFTDYCDGGTLVEYYCEKNYVKEKKENGGIKKECGDGKLTKGIHIPELPSYPLANEKNIEPVVFSEGEYTVIVPQGYEELGQKYLEDFEYYGEIIPQFLGMSDPYWDKVTMKIYVSSDNGQSAGAYAPEGIFYLKKTQENIDIELEEITSNDPDGFLYKSNPVIHEFTHVILAYTPAPAWVDEGVAVYAQENNKQDSKYNFLCGESAWYYADSWNGYQYNEFPYSDLLEPDLSTEWYNTTMCFWEHFDEKFGADIRHEVFNKLQEYNFESIEDFNELNQEMDNESQVFINEILFPTVEDKDALIELLSKMGINKGENY